jgi:hypothetical protein
MLGGLFGRGRVDAVPDGTDDLGVFERIPVAEVEDSADSGDAGAPTGDLLVPQDASSGTVDPPGSLRMLADTGVATAEKIKQGAHALVRHFTTANETLDKQLGKGAPLVEDAVFEKVEEIVNAEPVEEKRNVMKRLLNWARIGGAPASQATDEPEGTGDPVLDPQGGGGSAEPGRVKRARDWLTAIWKGEVKPIVPVTEQELIVQGLIYGEIKPGGKRTYSWKKMQAAFEFVLGLERNRVLYPEAEEDILTFLRHDINYSFDATTNATTGVLFYFFGVLGQDRGVFEDLMGDFGDTFKRGAHLPDAPGWKTFNEFATGDRDMSDEGLESMAIKFNGSPLRHWLMLVIDEDLHYFIDDKGEVRWYDQENVRKMFRKMRPMLNYPTWVLDHRDQNKVRERYITITERLDELKGPSFWRDALSEFSDADVASALVAAQGNTAAAAQLLRAVRTA